MIAIRRIKFSMGQIVGTPEALQLITDAGQTPDEFLRRHAFGDWGDVCTEDWDANDKALNNGTRLLSAYSLSSDIKIWIITEADRSSTCVLLPSEY